MNLRWRTKKVILKPGHRPSKRKRAITTIVESSQKSRTNAKQTLPDTSAIPWLGTGTQG